MGDRWMTKAEACRYACVSMRTLESWMRSGLRFSKLPTGTVRIHQDAIDEFLGRFEVGPPRSVRAAADAVMERLG